MEIRHGCHEVFDFKCLTDINDLRTEVVVDFPRIVVVD